MPMEQEKDLVMVSAKTNVPKSTIINKSAELIPLLSKKDLLKLAKYRPKWMVKKTDKNNIPKNHTERKE